MAKIMLLKKLMMKEKTMTRIYINKIALLSLIFAFLTQINAQDYAWKAKIPKLDNEGFHKILISPDVTSKLENGFSDIRIFSSKNKEIPYILETEERLNYKDYFVEYKIIEKKEETKWPYYTRLIIHNPKRAKISNIQLLIRNSDVSKSLKLSGSDDKEKWYIIKDSYRFHAMYSDETTSIIKIIDFPLSNYEYFEVLIDDWKNNPINIQKAGYFNTAIDEGKYTEVSKPKISQLEKEEEKESVVKIVYDGKPQIDKITFKIEGPEFYFRDAEIQIRDSSLNKKKKYEHYFSTIGNVTLSSNSLNSFYLHGIRVGVLYLRIKNKDNEPLKIANINAEQINSYLIAKLKNTETYNLKFGDGDLAAPDYDLKFFKDDLPTKINSVKVSEIVSIKDKEKIDSPTGIHLDSAFIWVAIIAVIALLIYMVLKMLKDMKKN